MSDTLSPPAQSSVAVITIPQRHGEIRETDRRLAMGNVSFFHRETEEIDHDELKYGI